MTFRSLAFCWLLAVMGVAAGLVTPSCSMAAEAAAPAVDNRIEEIVVEGNMMILDSTVTHQMKTTVGDRFSIRRLREDIQALYKREFFDDIQVFSEPAEGGGIRLIIEVREKPTVRRIDYIGNKKKSDEKLLELTTLQIGGLFRQSLIEETIRQIREKYLEDGFNFASVEVLPRYIDESNVVVEIRVQEDAKVRIREVVFEGNEAFKDAKLRRQMKENKKRWLVRGKYKPDMLPTDIGSIRDFYLNNGYLRVQIGEPEVRIEDPRAEKREAEEAAAQAKLDEQLSGDLTEEERQRILNRAERQRLERAERYARKTAKRFVYIKIPLQEGEPYTIKNINITGNTIYDDETLEKAYSAVKAGGAFSNSVFVRRKSKVRPGVVYSKQSVNESLESITTLYSSKGFMFSNVFPVRVLDDMNLTVDLTYDVTEGDQAWLRSLEFSGNSRTRDKVLRRQMLIEEGDVFALNRFRSSIERIFYLGYIENPVPDVKPDPDDPTQVDVVIDVDDQRRTELQLSGGYSSVDDFLFSGSVTEYNLFGYGQELAVSLTLGRLRQNYQVSFTDPYFLDSNNYVSAAVFNQLRRFDEYDRVTTGGQLGWGFNLTPFSNMRFAYRYERVTIEELSSLLLDTAENNPEDLTSLDQAILDAEGTSDTSALTWAISYDRRNNRRDPSRGTFATLRAEYAGGPMGGTNTFYKWETQATTYVPLFLNTFFAINGVLRFADSYGDDELPVFEYYRLGGETSIRGTEFPESFGRLDGNLQSLGGNKMAQFNFEYVIPLAGPLRIAAFVDTGDVWSFEEPMDFRTMRPTFGAELRFLVPQFWVPVRFIYAYNPDPIEGIERSSNFQFAIGTVF